LTDNDFSEETPALSSVIYVFLQDGVFKLFY